MMNYFLIRNYCAGGSALGALATLAGVMKRSENHRMYNATSDLRDTYNEKVKTPIDSLDSIDE